MLQFGGDDVKEDVREDVKREKYSNDAYNNFIAIKYGIGQLTVCFERHNRLASLATIAVLHIVKSTALIHNSVYPTRQASPDAQLITQQRSLQLSSDLVMKFALFV